MPRHSEARGRRWRFAVSVIAGIVIAIRWLTGAAGGSKSDRALEILRERYARGEIDEEEFEAEQRDLR